MPEAARVRRLFAQIARRYDRANDVLSLGIHRAWRRHVVRAAGVRPGSRVLDVCTGTGDVALALRGAGAYVIGADFCPAMLHEACPKAAGPGAPRYVAADALRLPFADGAFDAVTVAFGIRNVEDPVAALTEMARVCRPGGRVVVLEFCRPKVPWFAAIYRIYFRSIMPRLGAWVTGDREGAYRYLQQTVEAFPEREEFVSLMRRAHLCDVQFRPLSLGIAGLYHGVAGPRSAHDGPRLPAAAVPMVGV